MRYRETRRDNEPRYSFIIFHDATLKYLCQSNLELKMNLTLSLNTLYTRQLVSVHNKEFI